LQQAYPFLWLPWLKAPRCHQLSTNDISPTWRLPPNPNV
jgi:hypothetical protein